MNVLCRLSKLGIRFVLLQCPIWIITSTESCGRAQRWRRRIKRPAGWKGNACLGEEIRLSKVSDHARRGSCAIIVTLAGTLSEDDMDGRSPPAKLYILDSYCCGTYRGSA